MSPGLMTHENWINTELIDCGQPPFDSVRAAYQEGAPVYPAGFPGLSHIHLGVIPIS